MLPLENTHTGYLSLNEDKLFCTNWTECAITSKWNSNTGLWKTHRFSPRWSLSACAFYKISLTLEMSHRKKKIPVFLWLSLGIGWARRRTDAPLVTGIKLSRLCWAEYVFQWVVSGWGCTWGGCKVFFFYIYILILHWNTISVCTQANLFVSMPHVFMYTCGGAGRSIEAKSMWS